MTRTATARRLATGAAYGGGSVGLAGAALFALLREEARAARRKVEARTNKQDPPSGDGIYGRGKGKPLVFTVLGDSSAVGLGVERATETPGVLIAAALDRTGRAPGPPGPAGRLRRRVPRPRRAGRQGAGRAPRRRADHDRRQRRHQPDPARGLGPAPRRRRPPAHRGRLRGRRRHLPRPRHHPADRPAAAHASPAGGAGSMAAAQTVAVVEAGGRTVSLGSVLGPAFASDRSMFSIDEFHPSAVGYAQAAAVLLPSVADAVGVWPASADRGRAPDPPRHRAARSPRPPRGRPAGPAPRSSRPRCAARTPAPAGPWALLRRRRPTDLPTPEQTEESAETTRRQLRRAGRPSCRALPRSSFGGDPTSADRPRTRLIVEDPCPKPSSSRPPAPPSAARSRGR